MFEPHNGYNFVYLENVDCCNFVCLVVQGVIEVHCTSSARNSLSGSEHNVVLAYLTKVFLQSKVKMQGKTKNKALSRFVSAVLHVIKEKL